MKCINCNYAYCDTLSDFLVQTESCRRLYSSNCHRLSIVFVGFLQVLYCVVV